MSTQELEVSAPQALAEQLRAVKPYLDRLLPDPARFGATLMITARRNPDLLKCDPASVVGAALVCAQLDLEPGASEHVWLIPRRNRKTNTIDCTLLLGKNGMKALAERHPAISSVRTGTVYEGDEFEYTTQPPEIRHTRKFRDGAEAQFWYAVAYRADAGAPHIAVLDRAEVQARRKHSASPDSGPWVTHFNAMGEKSAIRALWKELPSSLDMARAAQIDDSAGVVTPRDLLIGQPRLVDRTTGEIIDTDQAPSRGAGSAASGSTPDGATTVQEHDVAAAGPQYSAPEQQTREETDRAASVSPASAKRTPEPESSEQAPAEQPPHEANAAPTDQPAPARPSTTNQRQVLVLMSEELGWSNREERLARAGMALAIELASFKDLTFDQATTLIRIWAPQVESWRINRRSRLASAAENRNVNLPHLLEERHLPPAGELSARQCQVLIDELEVEQLPVSQPSTEESVSAPAADSTSQDGNVRIEFETMLVAVKAGEKARRSWRDSILERLGLESLDDLTTSQLQGEIALLRQIGGDE